MQIVLAPDSFKGSLSASHVCKAMQRGAVRVFPDADFILAPLADGGEGTVEAILQTAGGRKISTPVQNPLGQAISADWGILPAGRAILEMAQASGLTLIPENERDALRASTYGTGELIRAALDHGCKEILIGIGGSATTDGGTGALSALGVRFLGADGTVLPPGGASLNELQSIDLSNIYARLQETRITVLCDVINPLFGENGAAYIYGPQKGASPEKVQILDAGLRRLAQISSQTLSLDRSAQPGAGAAGGLGFGLLAFLNAELKSGIEVVLDTAGFSEKLKTADLVLTGEGAIDAQTLAGKTIAGVCREAKKQNVPVIAFGGKVSLSGREQDALGLAAAIPIPNAPMSLEECIARADELLADAVERVLRTWQSTKSFDSA